MSFASLETSADSSVPIELYEFSYQGITLYYTTTENQIVDGINTYLPVQMTRSDIQESGEIGKNNLTITAPDQFPVSLLFQAGPPDAVVTVVVKRVQLGALDTTDTVVIWVGRILTVNWPQLRSEITCESIFTSLRSSGLHRIYTINCPYALYDGQCKVVKLSFQETISGLTQTGNILTGTSLNGHPSGYYAGGEIIWQPSPGINVIRGIKNHVNNSPSTGACEITYEIPDFPGGSASVYIYAGCDHSFSTCGVKFSNSSNFGGWPYMTLKNPWGGNSVF